MIKNRLLGIPTISLIKDRSLLWMDPRLRGDDTGNTRMTPEIPE